MLSFLAVGAAALVASALTLFSGFGLGTLLLPVFALFFPIRVAVAATAVVHVLNNLFKLALLRRDVDRRVIAAFGVPAVLGAFPGAWLLGAIPGRTWLEWSWGGRTFQVTPLGVTMGALILFFAAVELVPALEKWRAPRGWLPLGGALSGFFGGLSGHQGALRAAFLSPLGMPPARFAATQSAIACLVDGARLLVYGAALLSTHAAHVAGAEQWPLVATATLCAFSGAWLATRLLPKVTLGLVRQMTGLLLLVVGVGLATGVV